MKKFFFYIKNPYFWIVVLLFLGMGSVPSILIPYIWIDILIIFMCVICYFKSGFPSCPRKLLAILLFLWLWFYLDSIFTVATFDDYVGLYIRSFEAFFILLVIKHNYTKILDNIYIVLWLLTIYGAVNFVMYMLFPFLFVPIRADSGYLFNTFSYVFFVHGVPQYGSFTRNSGLFWEPGVYQIPLNILLYFILIVKKKPFKSATLPILVLLSNSSTTGLMVMALIMLYRLFIINKTEILKSRLLFLIIPIILCFLFISVYDKFASNTGNSFGARSFDIIFGLKVIYDHPLFGIGNNGEIYNDMIYDIDIGFVKDFSLGGHTGNTNAIVAILMYLGFPVWLIFLYGLAKQTIFPYGKLFFCMIFMSLCSEPLTYTAIVWLISMSGYVRSYSKVMLYR